MNRLEIGQPLNIFVKIKDTKIIEKYDLEDRCMKAAISSFEIILDHAEGSIFGGSNEPQILFHLKEFPTVVNYVREDGAIIDVEGDKEADVVACAAESILKILHKCDCVGKKVITFQSRRGEYLKDNLRISALSLIVLDEKIKSYSLNMAKGVISRAYAYLEERKFCLFLNDTSASTINKLIGILIKFFPRIISRIPINMSKASLPISPSSSQ